MSGGVWAIVPIKPLAEAKSRLSGVLEADERKALAVAMFRDVMAAVQACPDIAGLCVVTSDPTATALAYRKGAVVIPDPPDAGLSEAFSAGAALAERLGAEGVLLLPADLPLVRPSDVAAMVRRQGKSPLVRIVPAECDAGTNAMALWPPKAIAPCYGPGSLVAHLRAAAAAGVEIDLPKLPRLGLDIDRPQDLAALRELKPGRATKRVLRSLHHDREQEDAVVVRLTGLRR